MSSCDSQMKRKDRRERKKKGEKREQRKGKEIKDKQRKGKERKRREKDEGTRGDIWVHSYVVSRKHVSRHTVYLLTLALLPCTEASRHLYYIAVLLLP